MKMPILLLAALVAFGMPVSAAQGIRVDEGVHKLHKHHFSDRTDRIAGHFPTRDMVEHWDEGVSPFGQDPPNASLSIASGKEPAVAVIVLTRPEIEGRELRFQIEMLQGKIPETFGESFLFIDDLYLHNPPGSQDRNQ